MSDEILFEVADGVALVTFNRPDAMNTFSSGMMIGLGEAYRRCDEDDDVRAVVVTGSGNAFCAGAQLRDDGDTFNTGGAMVSVPARWISGMGRAQAGDCSL